MKRFICLALCVLAAILACACDDSKVDNVATQDTATVAETKAETVAPTQPTGKHGLKEFIKRFDTTVTVEEKIVYKDADFEVKVLGIDYSSASGPELKLSFKNNLGKDITVQAPYAVVNGFMIKPEMSAEVEYAKNGSGSLALPYYNLAMANITTLRDIEFTLRIVETKSYNPVHKTDLISVKTSAYKDDAEPDCDDSGQLVYDSDDIKIVIKGLNTTHTSPDGAELLVYMYNGTDSTIAIQTSDVTVNGYDMTSVMNRSILPGKHAVDAVPIYAQDLDEHNIDEIDSIKVSFLIKDAESWEDIDSTDTISVDLKAAVTEAPTEAPTEAETEK